MAKTETQIEVVTMEDGRVVDFPGKRKLQKSTTITPEGSVQVRLDFRNGQTRLFTVPANLLTKFAAHGAEQKLGDEIAGLEDLEDAVLAMDELIDRLYNGEWGVRKESSGMAGTSILAKALMQLTGKSAEQIREFLKSKSQADKITLRNSSKVRPIIAELEAAKASKGPAVDVDAMLGELA